MFSILYFAIASVLITVIAVVVKYFKQRGHVKDSSNISKQEIRDLIVKGIQYEDDFINTYFEMLRNDGYMHTFGGYESQAHDLLFNMIQESKSHKMGLEKILEHF